MKTWLMGIGFVAMVAAGSLFMACGETENGGGSTCAQTESCIQQCAVDQCQPTCIAALSTAATPYYNALEQCTSTACATPTDGGATPPCLGGSASDCTACVNANCAAQLAACSSH
jgi:hypothetical protein